MKTMETASQIEILEAFQRLQSLIPHIQEAMSLAHLHEENILDEVLTLVRQVSLQSGTHLHNRLGSAARAAQQTASRLNHSAYAKLSAASIAPVAGHLPSLPIPDLRREFAQMLIASATLSVAWAAFAFTHPYAGGGPEVAQIHFNSAEQDLFIAKDLLK